MTCEELAQDIDISVGSVHSIIRNRLGMKKVSSRWVPHQLTSAKIERRRNVATDLLSRFEEEGNDFISKIVAIDETWIRSYEPEMKTQSAEWHTPNSPRPVNFRRGPGKLKMLMIFAYDILGILTSHVVPSGQTVNGKYYREYLRTCLRQAIRRKRPNIFKAGQIILHDNATPHISEGGDVTVEGK